MLGIDPEPCIYYASALPWSHTASSLWNSYNAYVALPDDAYCSLRLFICFVFFLSLCSLGWVISIDLSFCSPILSSICSYLLLSSSSEGFHFSFVLFYSRASIWLLTTFVTLLIFFMCETSFSCFLLILYAYFKLLI